MSEVNLTIVETPIEVDLTVTKGVTVAELNTKENDLGDPTIDGYILSSTIAGVRSWIAKSAGAVWGSITGNITDQTDLKNALDAKKDTFTENTGFNKDLGTTTGTVSEGDHTHTSFNALDIYGEVDHKNQDVVGVKDLECASVVATGNLTTSSNITAYKSGYSVQLEKNTSSQWARCAFNSPSHSNTRFIIAYNNGTMAIKNLSGLYIDFTVSGGTGLRINGDKSIDIYDEVDHNNQDVTNVKDLDCATIDVGNGATGSFTSNDGKTVTVTKGIITSIV